MQVKITAVFDSDEDDVRVRVLPILKDLGIGWSDGDIDGRRWIQIVGVTDESGLNSIVGQLVNKQDQD